MPNPFSIDRTTQEDIIILSIEGYLDAHTAPKFEETIQSEIDKNNVKIIVECKNLTYISSAGLGVFMGFIEEIRDKEGDIKICGLDPKVKQIFDILHFETIYDILPDIQTTIIRFAECPVRKD
ncbi:MAG: STAS domain-containing protein [Acidobacteria bacterium]|nr:STAS domain-containing protein [Acidobacteriota bacterium]